MRQLASVPVWRTEGMPGAPYPTLPCLAHALFCMPCHMRRFHAACRPICPAGRIHAGWQPCMPGAVTHRALPLDARCTHVVRCVFWRPDVLTLRRVLHALRHAFHACPLCSIFAPFRSIRVPSAICTICTAQPAAHMPPALARTARKTRKATFIMAASPLCGGAAASPPSLLYARHTGKAWQSSLSPFTHQGRLFARAIIQLHFSGHCG